MTRVEHAPNDFLVDAERGGKSYAGQAALPECNRKCRFGRHAGRHRNDVFTSHGCAGVRDWIAVVNASG